MRRYKAGRLRQLNRTALLDYATAIEDEDAVEAAEGAQAVGGDQGSAPRQEALQGGGYLRLGGGVQVGGGFVEQEQGGVLQEGARQGEALRLPAAEAGAALADGGIVTQRQAADELIGVCQGGGAPDIFHAGVRARQAEVGEQGIVEQVRLLRHPGEAGSGIRTG